MNNDWHRGKLTEFCLSLRHKCCGLFFRCQNCRHGDCLKQSYHWQECIPVGCVPPAAVAVPGGLHQAPPGSRHPPGPGPSDRHNPPREQKPPRDQAPPGTRHSPEADPPDQALPLWKESQTPVETLPCPNFVAGGKNYVESLIQLLCWMLTKVQEPFDLFTTSSGSIKVSKAKIRSFIKMKDAEHSFNFSKLTKKELGFQVMSMEL